MRQTAPQVRSVQMLAKQIASVYNTHYAEPRAYQAIGRDSWQLQRTRGSHHQFVHPTKQGTFTVPHPKKDLGKGLVQAIRKQAGLK